MTDIADHLELSHHKDVHIPLSHIRKCYNNHSKEVCEDAHQYDNKLAPEEQILRYMSLKADY